MDAWGKGRARAFWNVWGRESWEGEGGKVSLPAGNASSGRVRGLTSRAFFLSQAKIVVQVDESGGARPLLFGDGCAPHVVVRVQPLVGNMCR